MNSDLRLIEDYLPIEAISAEASREKSIRKGHISTLHLWWARRPLVACRAAVYGALVPADRWVKELDVKNPLADPAKAAAFKNGVKRGLNRKAAKEFVTKLCRYPKTDPTKPADIKLKRETEAAIVNAQKHILEAHADRLTAELIEAKKTGKPPAWVAEFKFEGDKVTYETIVAGRAPRPRVLDMFAGGGAIPLEALRLGCEAYALDLNPVAHIIQLCTLVYPQKYGKPDAAARGMTGPKNAAGETTWGGLADEVRYWGNWVLEKVRAEIGDLYPLIPDPAYKPRDATLAKNGKKAKGASGAQSRMFSSSPATGGQSPIFDDGADGDSEDGSKIPAVPPGYLMPVAYLWTRTVRCKNPACAASVPLLKQSWLCKKDGRNVALIMRAPKGGKQVSFEVIESATTEGLEFDPDAFSIAGNATCPFCGAVADSTYVKKEGREGRLGQQSMAVVCTRPHQQGKTYLAGPRHEVHIPDEPSIIARIKALSAAGGPARVEEAIINDAKNASFCVLYGLTRFRDLYTQRQMLSLLTFCQAIRIATCEMRAQECDEGRLKAIATCLSCVLDKQADFNSSLCVLKPDGGRGIVHTFGRQSLPMIWDFAEANPFNTEIACWIGSLKEVADNVQSLSIPLSSNVYRGSATSLPLADGILDAVLTDPPYYDNVPYSNISDFFYVWLKRSVGDLYPEHFAGTHTPKVGEAVADATRHGSDRGKATRAYEGMLREAFAEAVRVLKPNGQLVVVYAHKTTLGWSTLVEALRTAGATVTEAWPLNSRA